MFCKKCGQQLPEGSKFCPNCGADNTAATQNQSQNQNQQDTVFTGTVNGGSGSRYNRSIAVCILLSIVTCGIYSYVWLYQLTEDLRSASGDTNAASGGMVILLSIVTCGIYMLYWLYKSGEQVNTAKAARGLAADTSLPIIYLILGIFGFSIVSMALMQNELNNLAA